MLSPVNVFYSHLVLIVTILTSPTHIIRMNLVYAIEEDFMATSIVKTVQFSPTLWMYASSIGHHWIQEMIHLSEQRDQVSINQWNCEIENLKLRSYQMPIYFYYPYLLVCNFHYSILDFKWKSRVRLKIRAKPKLWRVKKFVPKVNTKLGSTLYMSKYGIYIPLWVPMWNCDVHGFPFREHSNRLW